MTQESPATRFATMLEAQARKLGEWIERPCVSGSHVFESQAEKTPVCVLTEGLVKLYYPVAGGEEWTKSYIVDRGVFGPSSAGEMTTQFGARAIEDCSIGTIRVSWLIRQLEEDNALKEVLAKFQSWLFERKRKREEDLLCLAAEQRYLAFVEKEPVLNGRLEQQEVASYLRVTPVALSRIRRRLKLQGRMPASF